MKTFTLSYYEYTIILIYKYTIFIKIYKTHKNNYIQMRNIIQIQTIINANL